MAETLQDYSTTETPTPDTGALQTDLLELLRGIITRIQTPLGKVIDQIVVGHYPQPELEEVRRAYWKDRFNRAEVLIQRAKDRGTGEQDFHSYVSGFCVPCKKRRKAFLHEKPSNRCKNGLHLKCVRPENGG